MSFRLSLALLPVLVTAATHAQAPVERSAPIDKPSTVVSSALDAVAKAGSNVDLNKWKGSNNDKQDVDGDLASIQKDLQATLPPMLQAADAAPISVSASLPVLLNIDALYNVLLRVSMEAKDSAPREQAQSLAGALSSLDGARRDLGERITKLAASQEKQLAVMQTTLQQQAAQLKTAQTPPPPPPAPAAKKKKAPAAKPAPAPAKQ